MPPKRQGRKRAPSAATAAAAAPEAAQHEEDADDDNRDVPKEEGNAKILQGGNYKIRARQQKIIDSLHEEMEVTGYARGRSGQKQKKLPRHISKVRTIKRKRLEKADDLETAILMEEEEEEADRGSDDKVGKSKEQVDEVSTEKPKSNSSSRRKIEKVPTSGRKRARGGRAALDDDVVEGTMIFQTQKAEVALGKSDGSNHDGSGDDDDDDDDDDLEENEDGSEAELDPLEDDSADGEEDEGFDEDGSGDEGGSQKKKSRRCATKSTTKEKATKGEKKKAGSSSSRASAASRKRRRMYRLRNFESFRMAQKHGDALAAHARGDALLAIEKLKAVAKAAPSAPQVYSSLGMVYEDLLKESRRRYLEQKESNTTNESDASTAAVVAPAANETTDTAETQTLLALKDTIPEPALAEQLKLAEKAYGSHHIAAILCKKDFALWVRAADAAIEVANVHGDVTLLPNISAELIDFHRSEKQRWQNEAMRDISVADNLKPPGIDIPCKLASLHIELGNLSQALTILADLKNQAGAEFQTSSRAWLLYADLMLRLGHECVQWNRGNQTNQNYMARRWLRKFSKDFNWQERRIQALSLALETAAGTMNTEQYISWVKKRAIEMIKPKKIDEDERYHIDSEGGTNNVDMGANTTRVSTTTPENPDEHPKKVSEEEKDLLLARQSKELEAFDKTTSDMDHALGSEPATNRSKARESLLKSHGRAIETLTKEFNRKETALTAAKRKGEEEEIQMIGMNTQQVPVSGSIRQVCLIASDLMKHLHGLGLYEGARLVGEAVSNYLKDRARKLDKALLSKQKAEEWQQKVTNTPFLLESYEEADAPGNSDDDEAAYLSDEERLLNSDDHELLSSLRRGALPPELRVMYGLSLIAVGGRNFVAANCLRVIDDLETSTKLWLSNGEREIFLDGDPLWILFRRAMTEPLSQTAAYAFLTDVLSKTKKEPEWAEYFAPYFRKHVEMLKNAGLLEKFLPSETALTANTRFRKNQVLKVIVTSCRYDAHVVAGTEASVKPALRRNEPDLDGGGKTKIAIHALSTLAGILPLLWTIDKEGLVSPNGVEAVRIASACIKWIAASDLEHLSYSELKHLLYDCTRMLSLFCGEDIPHLDERNDEAESLPESTTFPLKSSWQSKGYRALSTRAYNLAVACNVPLYPGWQSDEFTLIALTQRYGKQDFGVCYSENRTVVGYLRESFENELKRQWKVLREMGPQLPQLDVEAELKRVRDSDWLKREKMRRQAANINDTSIVKYVEDHALDFFLSYSALSLHMSQSESDVKLSDQWKKMALSVLIPVSQFCLDKTLWDCDIGGSPALKAARKKVLHPVPPTARAETAKLSVTRVEQTKTPTNARVEPPKESEPQIGPPKVGVRSLDNSSRQRKKKHELSPEKKVKEWVEGSEEPILGAFISIPAREMKKLWFGTATRPRVEDSDKEQMQKVHKTTQDLRACFTNVAAEQVCLKISTLLLETAALPSCHDPFTCLLQAASFASQAKKAGDSDKVYRLALLKMTKCTPLNALNVLGRADCLHSVYFPKEAAYLCSYVARVCRLHRDKETPEHEWNDQWKLVGIYAFNVSVMIRATVSTVLDQSMRRDFLFAWDCEVVEELERGRKDGMQLKRRIAMGGNTVDDDPSGDKGFCEDFTEESGDLPPDYHDTTAQEWEKAVTGVVDEVLLETDAPGSGKDNGRNEYSDVVMHQV